MLWEPVIYEADAFQLFGLASLCSTTQSERIKRSPVGKAGSVAVNRLTLSDGDDVGQTVRRRYAEPGPQVVKTRKACLEEHAVRQRIRPAGLCDVVGEVVIADPRFWSGGERAQGQSNCPRARGRPRHWT